MEMPFFFWRSQNPTVLPGDQIVYQVGDYLAVFYAHTRQIADLGPGRDPVAIIPDVQYPRRE